jgi:flavin reductase (DIM6/NTAB) family NADH-FMN oxidoreductase RutF
LPANGKQDLKEHGWETREGTADSLRAAMGLFPTGVTVVTTGRGEATEGMTANAVISVSLDPLLLLVSVRRTPGSTSVLRKKATMPSISSPTIRRA